MEVKELKKQFESMEKKFKLPSFRELDDNFEIFKVDRESDNLLRAVRKQMMEKIVNSLSFVEMLLNQVNAPRMYFTYMKTMSANDRKILEEIYKNFAELIVSSLQAEVIYHEKDEADLIREINKVWKENAANFSKILANIQKPNGDNTNSQKKERNYFG